MIFTLIYHFKDNVGNERTKLRPDHLKHLESAGTRLKAAGPIMDDKDQEVARGSHIVIEAESRTAASLFAETDPFVKGGIVAYFDIHGWTPGIGEWTK